MNLFENGLKTLTPDERKAIAVGIRTTEYGWPLGMPTCDSLGHGLWEVRVSLKDKIARVFFCMEGSRMIFLHGIIKKDQVPPKVDVDTARDRKRDFERRLEHWRKKGTRKMSEDDLKSPIGSSFESFLEEEGILDEVDELAIKKVIAWQMEQNIAERGMSKSEFADAMKTSRTQVNRLLDPVNTSISMHTLCRAAAVFGKSLRIEFVDREEKQHIAA